MYRGGKICLDIHFTPLWAKNIPKLGIAHALQYAVNYNNNSQVLGQLLKFQCQYKKEKYKKSDIIFNYFMNLNFEEY